jgi:hypothetical protein
MNDGDWVESCTALVEDYTGTFAIVEWHTIENPKPEQNVPINLVSS